MIYSNNKPLVLTESTADEFLESVGVELFDDEISINGTIYEGTYGESILEENGIFLYEDCIVLEGEAAKKVTMQDYISRKAKEKADAKKADNDRVNRRLGNIIRAGKDRDDERDRALKQRKADTHRRFAYADKMEAKYNRYANTNAPALKDNLKKEMERAKHNTHPTSGYYSAFHATDSIERHNRKMAKKYGKSPKTESTIFADIEII